MHFTQSWLAVGAVVISTTLPSVSWAKSSLDLRLERLENIIDNQINTNLLTQLDAMQQEVQELRGKIELQQNELKLLSQKQDKLYSNLDSRLGGSSKTEAAPIIAPVPISTDVIDQVSEQAEQTEKVAYENAYQLMNAKKYPEAIAAFKAHLARYHEGTFAPNTHYWLGELYLAQWQQNRQDNALIEQAKDSFATVIDRYKGHQKAGDALLKLGLVEVERGHWLAARDLLSEVVQKYPDTSRAKLAELKIQTMQQDGQI